MHQKRLAARLCPDPLREFKCSPDPLDQLAAIMGGIGRRREGRRRERVREGRRGGGEGKGKGRGRGEQDIVPPLFILQFKNHCIWYLMFYSDNDVIQCNQCIILYYCCKLIHLSKMITATTECPQLSQCYMKCTCPFGKAPGHLGSSEANSFPNPLRYCTINN